MALFYELLPRLSCSSPFLLGCSSLIKVGSRQPVAGEPSKRKEKAFHQGSSTALALEGPFITGILVSKPYSMYFGVMKVIRKQARESHSCAKANLKESLVNCTLNSG